MLWLDKEAIDRVENDNLFLKIHGVVPTSRRIFYWMSMSSRRVMNRDFASAHPDPSKKKNWNQKKCSVEAQCDCRNGSFHFQDCVGKRHLVQLPQIWPNGSINKNYGLIRQGFTQ